MPGDYRIIISPEASANIQSLHAFIAKDSPNNAAKVVEGILDAIVTLKMFPHRTVYQRPRGKTKHPVRKLPVKPYVIYFRAIDDQQVVRILTIRHGARRPPKRFE